MLPVISALCLKPTQGTSVDEQVNTSLIRAEGAAIARLKFANCQTASLMKIGANGKESNKFILVKGKVLNDDL